MINIKEKSRDFTEIELYLMTIAANIISLKDVEDETVIDVDGFLVFDDEKDGKESVEIMSIITKDKKVYSCQSATFKKTIRNIKNIMADKDFSVVKISGKSKSNREFIDCILDIRNLL